MRPICFILLSVACAHAPAQEVHDSGIELPLKAQPELGPLGTDTGGEDEDAPAPDLVEYEDVGMACIMSSKVQPEELIGAPVDALAENQSAHILVVLDACITGSAFDEITSCAVEINGGTIDVTATASYQLPLFQTMDCNLLSVWCETPELEAGDWTLSYAGKTVDLTISGAAPVPCTDSLGEW